MQAFREEARAIGDMLTGITGPLWIRLEVALPGTVPLTTGHDVENYLTPLMPIFARHDVVLVLGEKRHDPESGPSSLSDGRAEAAMSPASALALRVVGSASTTEWKESIRTHLHGRVTTAAPGALEVTLEVTLALRCGPRRSWTNLWKPAGDALGPLLGEPNENPFHPADDRITRLALHRGVDPALGDEVEIGLAWCPAASGRK